MNERGIVSVIIPFFNAEKYIPSCVSSLRRQKFTDFEAIFVSDGSNDESETLLRECKDDRIKIYRIEKSGVSAARNFGLKKASGKYIAFMDVDDELESDYLSVLVSAMEQNDVDIVLCNYTEIYISSHTKKVLLPWHDTVIDKDAIRGELLPKMIAGTNGGGIRGLVWRTFVKRELIEKEKLVFVEGIPIAEDLLFCLQLYNRARGIFVAGDCLYNYKINPKSTLNGYQTSSLQNYCALQNALGDILTKEGLYEQYAPLCRKNYIRNYSYMLSNAVRNPQKREIKAEIKQIREYFLNEKIDYRSCELPKSIKFAYWLLEKNMTAPLILMYSAKERIRQIKGL